jgi:hypothetical protein
MEINNLILDKKENFVYNNIDSRQQTADSRQQTADSRQQTADSRQQTADSRQQLLPLLFIKYQMKMKKLISTLGNYQEGIVY